MKLQAKGSSRYTIAYDIDCGPCRRFKNLVDTFDVLNKIDFISLTKADEIGLLNRIPVSLRYKSFHLIFPNGDVKSGDEAVVDLIALLPMGGINSALINYIPWLKYMVRFAYQRLSTLHDLGSCRYKT